MVIYYLKKNGSSFTVFMCVGGSFEIKYGSSIQSCKMGETVLIPADLKSFSLAGRASILEIYIS